MTLKHLSCALFISVSSAALAYAQSETETDTQTRQWRIETLRVEGQRIAGYQTDQATVTRLPVGLHHTPQSIQVLTDDFLQEQDLTFLAEALDNISGVVPALPSEAVLASPLIRGFEAEVYIDGLPVYGDTAVFDPTTVQAVSQIEVLKGPSSTLFGGGTGAPVGGLINVVSQRPLDELQGEVSARIGSFQTRSLSGHIHLPLQEEVRTYLRLDRAQADDWIDHVEQDRLGLEGALEWDVSPQTLLTLRAHYNQVEQLEYAGLPAGVINEPGVDLFQFSGAANAPKTHIENLTFTGTLDHTITGNWNAKLRVRHYQSDFDEHASFTYPAFFPPMGTQYALLKGQLPTQIDQSLFDASLSGHFVTGAIEHTLLVGALYDQTLYNASSGFDFNPIGLIDFANPQALGFGAKTALTASQQTQYKTMAVYIEDHIVLHPRVRAQLGLRYSNYHLDERVGGQGFDDKDPRFDPRVGVSFNLAPTVSLFAGYGTGSRLSPFFTAAEPPQLETSTSYEMGMKWQDPERGFSASLAIYQADRNHVPTPDPVVPFASIQTGQHRAKGVEFDGIWEPNPAWSVLVSYAYTEAQVRRDTLYEAGSGLPRVPDHKGRIAVQRRILDGQFEGLNAGLGLNFASEAELALPNTLHSDAFAVVDAHLGYQYRSWQARLRIDNLFDETYARPYSYLGGANIRPGAPRSAYFSISYQY